MPSSAFLWSCCALSLKASSRNAASAPDAHSWQVMHAVIQYFLFKILNYFRSHKSGKKKHFNAVKSKTEALNNKS